MHKKFIALFVVILAFVLGVSLNPAFANNPKNDTEPEIPEKDGTYDVPGRPDLKVRVFVHNPKPSSSPAVTCEEDRESLASVDPAVWKLPNKNWIYYINLSTAPISSSNLEALTQTAFNEWSAKTNVGNKVTFSYGGKTFISKQRFDGKNVIAWRRINASALAITYIWYTIAAPNNVLDVDTMMNNLYAWSWTKYNLSGSDSLVCGDSNSYDAQNILTHELGHWVGLLDEYDGAYVNNTMFGVGAKGEIKKDTLTTGDIAGLSGKY